MDFEQKVARVGIAAAITLLSALGVVTYRASIEQEAAATWVAHTHHVIEELQKIVAGVAESESSVRAYSISRRASTLKAFEPGIALAEEGLAQAIALTYDNPAQQRLIQAVSPVLTERVRLLRDRKISVDRGEPAQVSEEAQRLTELIHTLVADAVAIEQRFLSDRNEIAADVQSARGAPL